MLGGILRLPLRLAKQPWRLVHFIATGGRRRSYTLAVAGLDESKAQPIIYSLRRAAQTPEEQKAADDWLAALSLCQLASARLLAELNYVEANLRFWSSRQRRGRHFLFALLQQGPGAFVGRLGELLHLHQRTPGRRRRALTQADLTERRVLTFRLLKSALAQALGQVQAAAVHLYLQQQLEAAAAVTAAGGQEGPAGQRQEGRPVPGGQAGEAAAEEQALLAAARAAVGACSAQLTAAFQQLHQAAADVLGPPPGPEGAQAEGQAEREQEEEAEEARVLHRTLVQVLGLQHLRRIFSHPELQPPSGQLQLPAAQQAQGPEGQAATPLERAQRVVGVVPLQPGTATVRGALHAAHHSAKRLQPVRLVHVPRWARMPSQLQQHWLQYAAFGLAASYGALFLYRHSPLAGSDDLQRWARGGVAAVTGAWKAHIVQPLEGVKDELFNTFRRRPSIVSYEEFLAERESLARMLADFERDLHGGRPRGKGGEASPPAAQPGLLSGAAGGSGAAGAGPPGVSEQDLQRGINLVMQCYEQELKKPLRNVVRGQLVRSLLIQVQKLKLDGASAALEMDQILKANELSISLVAAIPALVFATAGVYYLGRVLTPSPPDPRWEALPCRMAMTEVERALSHLAAVEEERQQAERQAGGEGEGAGVVLVPPGPLAAAGASGMEAEGLLAWRLAQAYSEARELFRRHRGLIELSHRSEWPNLRADMLELAAPGPLSHKLRTAQRIMRSYGLFHQF